MALPTTPHKELPKLVIKTHDDNQEAEDDVFLHEELVSPTLSIKTPTKRPLSLSLSTSSPLSSISTATTTINSTLPAFLSLPFASLNHKFQLIRDYEDLIRSNPNSLVVHPIAHYRNRHINVSPWSHHRIHLRNLDYSYINASPIDLGRQGETFIATQGPTDAGHFYEMCWQEEVSVVVMLTQPYEKGQEKCMVYYPDRVGCINECDEGQFTVECMGKREEERTEIRELKVTRVVEEEGENGEVEKKEDVRTLWHFLFLGWPDFDVPKTKKDEQALLHLIKISRFRIDGPEKEDEKDTKPRIVHCSAGVGRTGTFIALDHLIGELEAGGFDGLEEGVDPVFETVKKLRDQRMMMVYKESQYAFIYKILRERWLTKHGLGEMGLLVGENPHELLNDEALSKKRKLDQRVERYEVDIYSNDTSVEYE